MKKMLIIEDDQIVGAIYRHKCQAEGFQVELAGDGEAGWSAIQSFHPDVVILDLMLPKLNGVEILNRVRGSAKFKDLPVIVLSNAYLNTLVQDAWKAGANHCLIKANCSPKQLIEIVRKTLGTPGTDLHHLKSAPSTSTSPSTPAQPGEPGHDTQFVTEVRQTLLVQGTDTIAQLRGLLQSFIKTEGDTARLPNLFSLYRRVHTLDSNAAVAGLSALSKMASALAALIKELYEKPKNINPSTLRTLATSIDFLGILFEQGAHLQLDANAPPNILVVDDEVISRRAVILALEKAQLKCVSVDTPETALKLLAQDRFDLIFLDVDMPEMSGFDLCTRLRSLPLNRETPVVFVTSLTDFESRARSTLSGGNDLIAKPFLFIELAVKALTFILRRRLQFPHG
jgi:DNA-binding response OmpR family regulator